MEKLAGATLMLCLLLIAIPLTIHANPKEAKKEQSWFTNLSESKEKLTELHFYIQDVSGGPNPTVWEVARANITSTSPTSFGQVIVIDNLITAKPDRNSKKLGRVQGLYTFADFNEPALVMAITFVFTAGEYNGSTLCVLGRNPLLGEYREIPIVGGTGVFRMSRGYLIANSYSFDPVENYGVREYTLYVARV